MNLMLIGCGNIGGALLNLWAPLDLFDRIIVVQPSLSASHRFSKNTIIEFVDSIGSIPQDFSENLTILAIKPQNIDKIMPELTSRSCDSIVVSLLAGITLSQLSSFMLDKAKIVRIMPNVAIKTGRSVNLAFSTQNLRDDEISSTERVFRPSGSMIWVKKESYLDTLTPISGSGPAYFFLLAETLVEEAMKLGVEEKMARGLIQQVFIGSASLVADNKNFEALIQSVASKKGITEAALTVMTPNMKQTVQESLKVALLRLEELSNENCR